MGLEVSQLGVLKGVEVDLCLGVTIRVEHLFRAIAIILGLLVFDLVTTAIIIKIAML